MIDKLTTSEELSGLLNFALEGLKRLMEKGEFSKGISKEEMRELYLRMSDPIAAFIMDRIEIDPESYIPKKNCTLVFVSIAGRIISHPFLRILSTRRYSDISGLRIINPKSAERGLQLGEESAGKLTMKTMKRVRVEVKRPLVTNSSTSHPFASYVVRMEPMSEYVLTMVQN